MEAPAANPSGAKTRLLLIEADLTLRAERAAVLEGAGYLVRQVAGLPAAEELAETDVILADPISFEWLREHNVAAPIVVLTDDLKAGIAACLCGAADWVPLRGRQEYLLDAVREITTVRVRAPRSAESSRRP